MTVSWKKIATDVVTAGVAVGSVLAVIIAVAPSVNLPAKDIAYLVAASSIVAAVVAQARRFTTTALAAGKHSPTPGGTLVVKVAADTSEFTAAIEAAQDKLNTLAKGVTTLPPP